MSTHANSIGDLEVSNLSKEFGGLVAIDDVEFHIEPNSLVGLMGPNGAGKSTLINIVTGNLQPTAGEIYINGSLVEPGESPHHRVQKGVVKTFQDKLIFEEQTILNNVRSIIDISLNRDQYTRSSVRKVIAEGSQEETIESLLSFVGIPQKVWSTIAKNASILHRTKLSVCMALSTFPSILLLDEPMAGLNTKESEEIVELILELYESGMTIILIEHDIETVLALCNRILVLHLGRLIADDEPNMIRKDRAVKDAYIGTG